MRILARGDYKLLQRLKDNNFPRYEQTDEDSDEDSDEDLK